MQVMKDMSTMTEEIKKSRKEQNLSSIHSDKYNNRYFTAPQSPISKLIKKMIKTVIEKNLTSMDSEARMHFPLISKKIIQLADQIQ